MRPVAGLARERDAAPMNLDRLLVPIAAVEQVPEVVVRAQRRRREIMIERDLERVPEEGERLLRATAPACDQSLRVERLREDLREPEELRDLDRGLDPAFGDLHVPTEEMQPSELRGKRRQILVGLIARQDLEGSVHALERLLELPAAPIDDPEPGGNARRRVGQTLGLKQLERTLQVTLRALAMAGERCCGAGAFEQHRLDRRVFTQLRSTLEVVLRLVGGRQGCGPLARAREHLARGRP